MDAAMQMLLPGYSWRVAPTSTSSALDTLQSGLPVLRPWEPSDVTHQFRPPVALAIACTAKVAGA
jgi:hypothetical protein